MEVKRVLELATKLNIQHLSGKDCQRCLNLFNDDVDVVGNSSLGDDCIGIIEEVRELAKDSYEVFCSFVREHFCERLWEVAQEAKNGANESWIISAKQVATYCVILVAEATDLDAQFVAVEMLFKLCVLPNSTACGISNVNVLSTLSNLIYKYAADGRYLAPSSAGSEGGGSGAGTEEVDMRGRRAKRPVQAATNATDAADTATQDSGDEFEQEEGGRGEAMELEAANVEGEGEAARRSTRATRKAINYAESAAASASSRAKASRVRAAAAVNEAVLVPYCRRLLNVLGLFARPGAPSEDADEGEGEGEATTEARACTRNAYVELFTLRTDRGSQEASLDVMLDALLLLATVSAGGVATLPLPNLVKSVVSAASEALDQFASPSASNPSPAALLRLVRGMMPALSLTLTGGRLQTAALTLALAAPISSSTGGGGSAASDQHTAAKIRLHQHHAMVSMLLQLARKGVEAAAEAADPTGVGGVEAGLGIEVAIPMLLQSPGGVSDEATAAAEASTSGSAAMPQSFLCLAGTFQRMLLKHATESQASSALSGSTASSKVSTRNALMRSLKVILEHVYLLSREVKVPSGGSGPWELVKQVVSYVVRLAASGKIAVRTIAIDVITHCVAHRGSWLWTCDETSGLHGLKALRYDAVAAVVHRCDDISPAVRLRAVSGLHDLMAPSTSSAESLGSIASAFEEVVYCVTVGDEYGTICPADAGDCAAVCLLDTLRNRIRSPDEGQKSSLVTAKALQTLSMLLCRQYRTTNTPGSASWTLVHLPAEDVEMFANACNDVTSSAAATGAADASSGGGQSIVIRKQAAMSLTDLVQSRPYSTELVDAWVLHVLPMVFDSESSVVTAVAKCTHALCFAQLVEWLNSSVRPASASQGAGSGTAASSVWWMYLRIAELDRVRALKAAIAHLFQQGLFKGRAVDADREVGRLDRGEELEVSLVSVIMALKSGCMVQGAASVGGVDVLLQQQTSACWIMLDALLSQDSVLASVPGEGCAIVSSVLNRITQREQQRHQSTGGVGNPDFVVRCWFNLHPPAIPASSPMKKIKVGSRGAGAGKAGEESVVERSSINEGELRLLAILTRLSGSIPMDDCGTIAEQLLDILAALPLVSSGGSRAEEGGGSSSSSSGHLSTVINALYVLTVKLAIHQTTVAAAAASASETSGTQSQQKQQMQLLVNIYDGVQRWVGRLLFNCSMVLQKYVNAAGAETAGSSLGELTKAVGNPYVAQVLSAWQDQSRRGHAAVPVGEGSAAAAMEGLVQTALVTVGELALLGFSMDEEEDHFKAVPTHFHGKAAATPASSAFPCHYLISDVSKSVKFALPPVMLSWIQLLMGQNLPLVAAGATASPDTTITAAGSAEGSPSAVPLPVGLPISDVVRALSFITLGKCCMRSKSLSRAHINVFLREIQLPDVSVGPRVAAPEGALSDVNRRKSRSKTRLQPDAVSLEGTNDASTSTVATRCNALIVLGDMCIRYTNIIEGHVSTLSCCLQDMDVLIRKQAFVLLVQLVLQDFIKLKGVLLYRLFLCSVDVDPEFAEFAREVLRNTVLQKHPAFISSHFTEAVVIFNYCTSHPAYSSATAGVGLASGAGANDDHVRLRTEGASEARQLRRFKVYAFLMNSLTEEQKIHVTAKLVHDILAYATDNAASCLTSSKGHTAANNPFENVMRDTFYILQSPLLKVGSSGSAGGKGGGSSQGDAASQAAEEFEATGTARDTGDDGGEGGEDSVGGGRQAALLAKAKSKILKQLSKQHMIDTIVPVLSTLKHTLEAAKSPLQRACMEYFTVLVKCNRAEMDKALAHDPILKAELDYDIRAFEAAAAAAAAAAAQRKQLQEEEEAALLAMQQHFASAAAATATAASTAGGKENSGNSPATAPLPPHTPTSKGQLSAHATASKSASKTLGSRSLTPGQRQPHSVCPPTIRKELLRGSDASGAPSPSATAKGPTPRASPNPGSRTPNQLLSSVGSKLRVADPMPYGYSSGSGRTSRGSGANGLKSGSRRGSRAFTDTADAMDDEEEQLLLDLDAVGGAAAVSGRPSNSYESLQKTTTRRLSWNVTVNSLLEATTSPPAAEDASSSSVGSLSKKRSNSSRKSDSGSSSSVPASGVTSKPSSASNSPAAATGNATKRRRGHNGSGPGGSKPSSLLESSVAPGSDATQARPEPIAAVAAVGGRRGRAGAAAGGNSLANLQ